MLKKCLFLLSAILILALVFPVLPSYADECEKMTIYCPPPVPTNDLLSIHPVYGSRGEKEVAYPEYKYSRHHGYLAGVSDGSRTDRLQSQERASVNMGRPVYIRMLLREKTYLLSKVMQNGMLEKAVQRNVSLHLKMR